jgi:hypothetical protein
VNSYLRACIANIAGRLSGQPASASVYDHTQGIHIHISGTTSSTFVDVYDHARFAHINGPPANLYDHGLGTRISLVVSGTRFDGHDYGSGHQYSGNVSGSSVTIFDHESGRHHYYIV